MMEKENSSTQVENDPGTQVTLFLLEQKENVAMDS